MNEDLNEKSQEDLRLSWFKSKHIIDKQSEFDWDWIFEREWLKIKK